MNRTTKRPLTVVLNEDEKRAYAGELARITTEQSTLEDQKKEVVAEYAAKIKRCLAQGRELAVKISTGREMRDVECVWDYDYDSGIKTLFRNDNGEEVDAGKITEDEKQEYFDFMHGDERQEEAAAVQQEHNEAPTEPAKAGFAETMQEAAAELAAEDAEPVAIPPTLNEGKSCIMGEAGMAIDCVNCGHCKAEPAFTEAPEEVFPQDTFLEEFATVLDGAVVSVEEPAQPEQPTGPLTVAKDATACPMPGCSFDVGNHEYMVRHLRKTHGKMVAKGEVKDFACQNCKVRRHRKVCGPDCDKA